MGDTALDIATRKDHHELIKLFLDAATHRPETKVLV